MRRVVIAIGIAILALVALGLIQYGMRPRITVLDAAALRFEETTGVVRSFAETPIASSPSMKWVNVTLADGSVVQAGVTPGCVVHTGDAVRVRSYGTQGFEQRMYLVLGPA